MTALQFARRDERFIEQYLSKPYREVWHELNGRSVYPVVTETKNDYQSISKARTFTPPSQDPAFVFAQLSKNLENACIKARRHGLAASGLIVYLRQQDFRDAGIEIGLDRPSAYPLELSGHLRSGFSKLFRPQVAYRSTGVILAGLVPAGAAQLSIFDDPARLEKLTRLYRAVDQLAARQGKHCVFAAGAAAAHGTPQHLLARGDVPVRKLNRLPGETKRRHLGLPLLAGEAW
jgi:hypothetical protein